MESLCGENCNLTSTIFDLTDGHMDGRRAIAYSALCIINFKILILRRQNHKLLNYISAPDDGIDVVRKRVWC